MNKWKKTFIAIIVTFFLLLGFGLPVVTGVRKGETQYIPPACLAQVKSIFNPVSRMLTMYYLITQEVDGAIIISGRSVFNVKTEAFRFPSLGDCLAGTNANAR